MVTVLGPGLFVESFAEVDVDADPKPEEALDVPIDPAAAELVVLAPVRELRLVLPSRLLAAKAAPTDVAAANWLLGS